MRTRLAILGISWLGLAWAAPPAAAQGEKKPAAVIEYPKANGTIDQAEELEGRLDAKGWPVILVRAQAPGQPWWIQPPVDEVADGGAFKAQCNFGDAMTSKGTKFRVVVVVAKSRDEARKFKAGETRDTLPPGMPRSDYVNVVRN